MIQAFTRQIAQVLENAWLQEQSHRRSEELEVLSTLTFALGEAESRETILSAIVDQIKGTKVVYYQTDLEMINVESNEKKRKPNYLCTKKQRNFYEM